MTEISQSDRNTLLHNNVIDLPPRGIFADVNATIRANTHIAPTYLQQCELTRTPCSREREREREREKEKRKTERFAKRGINKRERIDWIYLLRGRATRWL